MTEYIEHYKNLDLADIVYLCEIDNLWKTEQWKDVLDYEGIYKVSDLSRVKSLARTKKGRDNSLVGVKEKILKPILHVGYPRVNLSRDKQDNSQLSHRLASVAFIPNPDNKPQVNHKNGIKTDTRIGNFEWATNGENSKHAYKHRLNLGPKGVLNSKAKITEQKVLAIRRLHRMNPNVDQKALAKKVGLTYSSVNHIIIRRKWKHI